MAKNDVNHFVSPLRYPGGKNCIFDFVSNLFYENSLIGVNYAEPYAGGAGLALRLLIGEYVNKIYINDLDIALYSFWYSVINHNVQLCDWVEDLKVDLDNWKYYKEIHNQKNSGAFSFLEIGMATFFLNRTNVSGVLNGGIIGGRMQYGKYKMDARFNKKTLIERISRLNNFKHRIKISKLDGVNFIKKIEKKKDDFFIYIDPPYVVKGGDLYMNFFKERDHKRLAKNVRQINKRWMVSYDCNDLIKNIYRDYRRVEYNLSHSTSNKVGQETIIFDNNLTFENSFTSLKNPNLVLKSEY